METFEKELYGNYSDLLLEIKDFYNQMLNETIELMNLYGCKTPLEIYCLFNMINDFYVKGDELFNLLYMNNNPIYSRALEEGKIKGIQTLLNGGVCRHRSAMLNDIYRKMGFDAVPLLGYLEMLFDFHYGNSQKKQVADRMYVEDMLEKISKGARIENFTSHLKRRKISYNIPDIHDDYFNKHKRWPNHAIVMVGGNNRYYLDPMNNIVYDKDDRDVATFRSRAGYYFFSTRIMSEVYWTWWLNEHKDLTEKYAKILQLPIANEEETINCINKIYSYLQQFKDDIEDFAKSKSNSIEAVRRKCIALPKNGN